MGAIDLRSFQQRIRNGLEELAKQEDGEHACQTGRDDGKVRIGQIQGRHSEIVRNNRAFAGYHHRAKEDRKQEFLALEFKLCKGKCRQRTGDQLRYNCQNRRKKAV